MLSLWLPKTVCPWVVVIETEYSNDGVLTEPIFPALMQSSQLINSQASTLPSVCLSPHRRIISKYTAFILNGLSFTLAWKQICTVIFSCQSSLPANTSDVFGLYGSTVLTALIWRFSPLWHTPVEDAHRKSLTWSGLTAPCMAKKNSKWRFDLQIDFSASQSF